MDGLHNSSDWSGDPTLSGAVAASGWAAHHAPSNDGPGCDQATGGHWRRLARPTRAGSPLRGGKREIGAVGWGVLWLLGIPIPILLTLFVLRGCT